MESCFIPLGITIVVNPLQLVKAAVPMLVKVSGRTTDVNMLHPLKAFEPMLVNLLENSTVNSFLQLRNAYELIEVTESGITIEARVLHPSNM